MKKLLGWGFALLVAALMLGGGILEDILYTAEGATYGVMSALPAVVAVAGAALVGLLLYKTGASGLLAILIVALMVAFVAFMVVGSPLGVDPGTAKVRSRQGQTQQWQVQTQPQVIQAAQPQQQTQQTQQQVQTAPASGSCRPPSGQQCPVGAWYHCNGAPTYQCPASGIWPP